ncbi:MAG: methylenetetrahydrofolate reductase [Steroidobacteraceae bacterium]
MPRQQWQQTLDASVDVRNAGFTPVPHVSARQLASARELDELLEQLVRRAGVDHLLLVAGDRAQPVGPFAASSDVLRTGLLDQHGIRHLSIAGHPEGHPHVSSDLLRAAELEKVHLAEEAGLEVSFLTQFAFDGAPIVQWAGELRRRGVRSAVRIGLAGPARLSTLLRYAVRCGVGPSIRALGSRAANFGRLLGERGPEALVRELARARGEGLEIDGIHLFSFGGLLRTCRWVRAVNEGRFALNDAQGFVIDGTG